MIDDQAYRSGAGAIALIRRSAIARLSRTVIERVERAARSSRSGTIARRIDAAWPVADRAGRMRAAGVAVMTAAGVHLALVSIQQVPAGWLWLVVPVIALAQGGLLLVWSTWHPRA